jgi:hypothetical protein
MLCTIMLNVTYKSFVLSVFMLTGIMLIVMSPLPCSVSTQPKQLLGYLLLSIGFQWNSMMKKNLNHCLNTNIYSYLETSGGPSSDHYLHNVHFFNNSVN